MDVLVFSWSCRETYVCVLTDGLTAFYAGLVVFTCMGFMAKESGLSVEEVAKSSGTLSRLGATI